MLRRYAHGLGNDDPVLWYEGSGLTTRRSLFADHQGSIVAVADASGNAVAINGYDVWGIPNATNQGRFGYTGQISLPEIGMWHYKARVYSPTLGRFLQTDPVGYDDQINLYAYVANDPVNRTDPTGTQSLWSSSPFEDDDTRDRLAQDYENSSRAFWDAGRTTVGLWANIVGTVFGGGETALARAGLQAFRAAERAILSGRTLVLWSSRAPPPAIASGEMVIRMRAGWTPARNERLIDTALRQGRPIRDSFVDSRGVQTPAPRGSVLERERNQIERAGWRYDRATQSYQPRTLCTGRLVATRTCQ